MNKQHKMYNDWMVGQLKRLLQMLVLHLRRQSSTFWEAIDLGRSLGVCLLCPLFTTIRAWCVLSQCKIDLEKKNRRIAFSEHDICILCENIHAKSAVQKIFFVQIICMEKCIQCVKALMLSNM